MYKWEDVYGRVGDRDVMRCLWACGGLCYIDTYVCSCGSVLSMASVCVCVGWVYMWGIGCECGSLVWMYVCGMYIACMCFQNVL